ncbi:HAMP domain-containing histidine kinase [Hyunsoonleella flava]|uniref:histidine kinase n=1 Tax=Hyunsoonleella flava TaxID=2527939 RepID=A0A4Q9FA76_9FLAO|nr:HAMP domain-containing sensor histidine kinase [Hyunsoonleella flava]TBM99365.1 HAMP domain-containing histidine kinase [Hyunsoonleella flava]
MKKNIGFLIFGAILGLVALSFIQGYLINNTYELEKKAFVQETKRKIFRFDDNVAAFDSIYDVVGSFVVDQMIDYKLNRLKKSALLDSINIVQESVNAKYISLCQETFEKQNLSFPIKFQKRLKSIIILDSIKNDTLIFNPTKAETLFLLGETFDLKNAYGINNSQTTTDIERTYEENGLQKAINLEFQIVIQDYFDIEGWETEVLKRMSGILALSVLIFALVLGLLYYSIKSLISQKKIADVKTDFINNITHELKTPLATLGLSTKMLRKGSDKPELINATVNTIERQTVRLQKLIDQVLDNSLGYHEIQLNKENVDISNYLNTVLDDFELSIKDNSVVLNRHINTDNHKILLDKFYVTTAIFNILENAIKYNSGDVVIDFKADFTDNLIILISDNGIGIPNKHHSQIFEKFYRAGNKEVHDVKGLGLGLYYTSQIIKAHGGEITVENSIQGAAFKIKIPFKA